MFWKDVGNGIFLDRSRSNCTSYQLRCIREFNPASQEIWSGPRGTATGMQTSILQFSTPVNIALIQAALWY